MDHEETQPESVAAAQKREQLKNRVLKTGESLGNFRVVKCISVGLLAHYYHMQHVRDLHDVTVCIFHHRAAGDDKFRKRLQGLKQTISSIDHECIPRIRDCSVIQDRLCVFLDPVEGVTLSQHFETLSTEGEWGMPPKQITRIIAQLLGALGYAHSQGLDHRDLDSDLIFVQEDGTVRILGLGLKATLGVELFESIVSASVSPLISSKTVGRLNSFDIMSPEYRSGHPEDARVDVYAVGFIAYWLLTGQKPNLAKYQSPTELVEDLDTGWDAFIERSLERKADRRFQSCKMALLGLKETESEPQSEAIGYIQRQIDRIPVPKGIVERGALASRMYRLFIIGLIGITLTAIVASFLSVSFDESVDYSREVAHLATADNVALNIQTTPLRAKVVFVGYKHNFNVKEGELKLAVQPGDYKLRFSAKDHIEQVARVSIPAKESEEVRLKIDMKPAWTGIEIRTEPDAVISITDSQGQESVLGVADEKGVLDLEDGIFAGTYQLLIEKEGYQPKIIDNHVVELGVVAKIDAPLALIPARVSVRSNPVGATVLIDDVVMGKTPLSLEDVMPSERSLIKIELAKYRSMSRQVELKSGAELALDFGQLVPLAGSIDIEFEISGAGAPDPATLSEDLQIVLDGQTIPYGDPQLQAVPVGEHTLLLEHPLYFTDVQAIRVEDRQTEKLEFIMNPRPGRLKLEVPHAYDTEVLLDGQHAQLEEGFLSIPANKAVKLELRIANHLTMLGDFKLSPNETYVWEVTPVAIPGPVEGQRWVLPYFGISFAWVPQGSFEMGSPLPEHARLPNEGPQTSVRFTRGFWAGSYEVTQAQFEEVMGQNPSKFKGRSRPVESVNWEKAKVFCEILTDSERTAGRLPQGYVYRLPTEPEWEYAARAGTETPFHFGDRADASVGHFRGVYPRDRKDGMRSPTDYGTSIVGRYQGNAFGLFDVHGNVREWTLDGYNGRLEGESLVDPDVRQFGERIAVRGGGWEDSALRVRSAVREDISPETESDNIGFRVFLAPEVN